MYICIYVYVHTVFVLFGFMPSALRKREREGEMFRYVFFLSGDDTAS